MRHYPDSYQALQGELQLLAQAQPEVMTAYAGLRSAATAGGALPARTKALLCLGIAVALRCEGATTGHIAEALRAGADRTEIADAIGVAVLMGGAPAAIHGARALEALRQFEASPKGWATEAL